MSRGRENKRQALLRARRELGLFSLSLAKMQRDPFLVAHLEHKAFGTPLPTIIRLLGEAPLKALRQSIEVAKRQRVREDIDVDIAVPVKLTETVAS